MNMTMTPQEQLAFNTELSKELVIPFPEEFIPHQFKHYAKMALQFQNLPSLRIEYKTYEKIWLYTHDDIWQLTYLEISFLINCILSATPHQLNIGDAYLSMLKEVDALSVKWNQLVNPIKERTARRVKAYIIRGLNPVRN